MGIPGPQNKIVVPSGVVCWLDVDDVLVDFHRLFNALIKKKGYDVPLNYIPSKYSYAELMPEEQFSEYFVQLGQNWPAKCKVFKGAAEFTRKLSEHGVRVILITSVFGHQGPERIKNLCKNHIYFDEIYLTKGRQKSEFASWLSTRYVDSKGCPVKNILVDDFAKNAVEFIKMVPNAVAGITMNIGYSQPYIKKAKNNKKLFSESVTQTELYDTTFRVLAQLMSEGK
jgi:hypothetical protein